MLDIIKNMNQVFNGGDPAYYRIPESREMIAQLLLLYENAGGVEAEKWVDYDYQRQRLMVEITDYDSAEGVRELRMIQERSKALFPDAKVLLIRVHGFTGQDVCQYGNFDTGRYYGGPDSRFLYHAGTDQTFSSL